MNRWLVQLHLSLVRHRWLVGCLVLLLTAIGLVAVSRLRLSEDFTDMLPMTDPGVARQMQALKWIRQADRLYFDVAINTPGGGALEAAADRLHEALQSVPELSDIRYRVDQSAMGDTFSELLRAAPELLTEQDLETLAGRCEPDALRQRLEWIKRALSQPQGLMLKNVAASDPLGLSDAVGARLKELQAGSGGGRMIDGRLTSADGRHVLMSASPGFPSSDHRRSESLMSAVLRAAAEVEAAFAGDGVRVAVTGAHRVALDNARLIRGDLGVVTGIATVAVTVLMMGAFRRRRLALWSLVPTALGALAAGAAFVLTGDAVSAIALGCGSCLVGVMVDCAIHVVYHLDDTSPANREEMATQLARLAPSVAVAGLTTVAAFLIMLVSSTAGHRQLGMFAAVGSAVSAAAALFLLPLAVPLTRPKEGETASTAPTPPLPLTRLLEMILRWRSRSNRLAWMLTGLISLAALVGLSRFRFESDLSRLNGVTGPTREADERIRETWEQSLALTTVIVTAPTWDEALALNEQVLAAIGLMQANGHVSAVSSVARLCPSMESRRAAWARWNAFWTPERRTALRTNLDRLADELGLAAGVFQPFLNSLGGAIERTRSTEAPAILRDGWLRDYWNEKDGQVALMTLVKIREPEVIWLMKTVLDVHHVFHALILNKEALGQRLARLTQRNLVAFAVLATGVNAVLLFLLLGKIRLVLVALIPILAGNFWTLGALGLFGHSLNFANLVFVVFVAGVSLDYCMFLMLARLDPIRGHTEREASAAASVTLCALTALAGVGALVFARHPALFSVGITALAGISLCLLATLLLVPGLMDWLLRPKKPEMFDLSTVAGRRSAICHIYDFQGPFVEQFVYWKLRTDPLFAHLDSVVPAEAFIVDLGCGYGLAAHWLTLNAPGRRILGADHDADKIRVAKATARHNPRVTFEFQDVVNWQCPACDAVLLLDVLHYLPDQLKARLLAGVFRALRPGGCLVLRDAARSENHGHRWVTLSERWAVWIGHNRTAHGLNFATAEEYTALLKQTGFGTPQVHEAAGLGSNFLWVARKPKPE